MAFADAVTVLVTVISPSSSGLGASELLVVTITSPFARAVLTFATLPDALGVHVPVFPPLQEPPASIPVIVTFVGSIRSMPFSPFTAFVSTPPKISTCCLPEISTKPPLPDPVPPFASIFASGRNSAVSGEYTMTSPPLPSRPAFAVVRLSELRATTSLAVRFTLPPSPMVPSAWIVPNCPTRAPSIVTCPPSLPEASIMPVLLTVPLAAASFICPVSPVSLETDSEPTFEIAWE